MIAIKNQTILNKDAQKKLNKVVLKKNLPKLMFFLLLTVFFSIFLLVVGIMENDQFSLALAIILLTILVFSFILISVFIFIGKKASRNSFYQGDLLQIYLFEENQIYAETKSSSLEGKTTYSYQDFTSIIETKYSFFLFIKNNSALFVDKRGFLEKDEIQLRNRLKSKVKKYQTRNYFI